MSIPGSNTSNGSHCSEDKDQTPHHDPQDPVYSGPCPPPQTALLLPLALPPPGLLMGELPSLSSLPVVFLSLHLHTLSSQLQQSLPRMRSLTLTLSQPFPSLLSEIPVLALRQHEIVQQLCPWLDCKPIKARGGSADTLLRCWLLAQCRHERATPCWSLSVSHRPGSTVSPGKQRSRPLKREASSLEGCDRY